MRILKKQFGKILKDLRKQRGFKTQEQFAEALETNQSTVARWETGVYSPDGAMFLKIKKVLKVDESHFAPGLVLENGRGLDSLAPVVPLSNPQRGYDHQGSKSKSQKQESNSGEDVQKLIHNVASEMKAEIVTAIRKELRTSNQSATIEQLAVALAKEKETVKTHGQVLGKAQQHLHRLQRWILAIESADQMLRGLALYLLTEDESAIEEIDLDAVDKKGFRQAINMVEHVLALLREANSST